MANNLDHGLTRKRVAKPNIVLESPVTEKTLHLIVDVCFELSVGCDVKGDRPELGQQESMNAGCLRVSG